MNYNQVNNNYPASSLPVIRHGKRISSDPSLDDRMTSQAQGDMRSHQTLSGERYGHRDAYLDMPRADDSRPSQDLLSDPRDGFERPDPLQHLTGVRSLPEGPNLRHFRTTEFEGALSQLCRTYGVQVSKTFPPSQASQASQASGPSVQPSVQPPSFQPPSNQGMSKADIRRASKANRKANKAVKPTPIRPNGNPTNECDENFNKFIQRLTKSFAGHVNPEVKRWTHLAKPITANQQVKSMNDYACM